MLRTRASRNMIKFSNNIPMSSIKFRRTNSGGPAAASATFAIVSSSRFAAATRSSSIVGNNACRVSIVHRSDDGDGCGSDAAKNSKKKNYYSLVKRIGEKCASEKSIINDFYRQWCWCQMVVVVVLMLADQQPARHCYYRAAAVDAIQLPPAAKTCHSG